MAAKKGRRRREWQETINELREPKYIERKQIGSKEGRNAENWESLIAFQGLS